MVQQDLGGFGDERLRRVGARLLEAMSEQPTTCVHALANDRNEALSFGRFLDHDAVSHGEMLTTAARSTGQRAAGRDVLAIQDTTEIEPQLQAEVAELMARAEVADQADLPDGMSIPEALARREARLAEIARARAIIEARAKERHAREQAEYDAKMAARKAKNLIPIASTFDRPRPLEIGKGTNAACLGAQGIPDAAASLDDGFDVLNTQPESHRSRRYSQTRSMAFSSGGLYGGKGTSVRFAGTITSSLTCQPALSTRTRACVRGGTWQESSSRHRFMPSVEARGSTRATPVSRSGQTAPKM